MDFNKIRFNTSYFIIKEFQLLQILNDLSIKHLIKIFLYENNIKLLKFNPILFEVTGVAYFIGGGSRGKNALLLYFLNWKGYDSET